MGPGVCVVLMPERRGIPDTGCHGGRIRNRYAPCYNPTMRITRTTLLLIGILLVSVLSAHAVADIVHLRDGSAVEGVVLEQNAREVIIEIRIGSIITKKRISIRDVDRVEYKELAEPEDDTEQSEESGVQAPDAHRDRPERDEPEAEADEPEQASDRVTEPVRASDRSLYVVIPITGRMGMESNATGLKNALEQSIRKKASHVIFTIDADGGYVYDAVETLEVLGEFDGALEYHAIVDGKAGGAASAYIAGADHVWVRPDSSVGGSIEYASNVEERFKRFDLGFHGEWADRMALTAERNGRSSPLFRAFADKAVALWIVDGRIVDARPMGAGAIALDTPTSVPTIDAAQLIELDIAAPFEGTPEQLGAHIGSDGWVEIRRIADSTIVREGARRVEIREEWDKTSAIIDDLMMRFERNDPRVHKDYGYELVEYRGKKGKSTRPRDSRLRSFILMPDANSTELWKRRCADAIRDCEHILEGLRKAAGLVERAQSSGMRHLTVDEEYANGLWSEYSDALAYLRNVAGGIPQAVLEDLFVEQNPIDP